MGNGRWVDRIWRQAFRAGYVVAMGYWAIRRPHLWGVGVAVWWEGRILLIDNSYKQHRSLPGGGIHRGESFAEAAARELGEEVGIRTESGCLTQAGIYEAFVDFKHDRMTVFEYLPTVIPVVRIDRREVAGAGFVSVADALGQHLNPMVRGYLRDCRSAGGPITSM